MSDSIFGDLDVASAADNPFEVPDNTYDVYLTKVQVRDDKNKTKKGLALTFTIEEGEHKGKNISHWQTIAQGNETAEDKRDMSFLKKLLSDLGIPADKMNSTTPDDLLGIHAYVTVKTNQGKDGKNYTNVSRIELVPAGGKGKPKFS